MKYRFVLILFICGIVLSAWQPSWAQTTVSSSLQKNAPQIGGCNVFPDNNVWNTPIDTLPTHPNSANFINEIEVNGPENLHPDFGSGVWPALSDSPIGIPFIAVNGNSIPWIPMTFVDWPGESDPGPYPMPLNAPREGGPTTTSGDRHVISIDVDNCMLYEIYQGEPQATEWQASNGAKFDLNSNALRPDGWTSADAAGLPIFPGLVRYDEVQAALSGDGLVHHALRFTLGQTHNSYIWPARHFASNLTDPNIPPMGLRFRLVMSEDEIQTYTPEVQVILRTLKVYGMIVADNGSAGYISGQPHPSWNNDNLVSGLHSIDMNRFVAIDICPLEDNPNSAAINPNPNPSICPLYTAPTNHSLVLFNPTRNETNLLTTLDTNPTVHNNMLFNLNAPTTTNNIVVMGDWDGDGTDTPGVYSGGVFNFTNDLTMNATWESPFWLGFVGGHHGLVAGRFDGGLANDCIGIVDGNVSPITGNLRFSMKYWCDMTTPPQGPGGGPLSAQYIGGILGDSSGFTGTHQFGVGDWDNDNIDEVASRRGIFITYTTRNPNQSSAFSHAQRWGNPEGHANDAGQFITGDWNGDNIDGWGVLYDDNQFYIRNDLSWNPGFYNRQTVVDYIGTPRQATAWFGGTGAMSGTVFIPPPPATPTELNGGEMSGLENNNTAEAVTTLNFDAIFAEGGVGIIDDSILWQVEVDGDSSGLLRLILTLPDGVRIDDVTSSAGNVSVRGQIVTLTVENASDLLSLSVSTTLVTPPTDGQLAGTVVLTTGTNLLEKTATVDVILGLPNTGYPPYMP